MNQHEKRLQSLERQVPPGERVWAFIESDAEARALRRRFPDAELNLYRWATDGEAK